MILDEGTVDYCNTGESYGKPVLAVVHTHITTLDTTTRRLVGRSGGEEEVTPVVPRKIRLGHCSMNCELWA